MEITGKIIAVLPAQSGVSQRTGNAWKSQEFVIETHEQFPKKCCFKVFGEERINNFNLQKGEEVTVSFSIDCHEYNGRWFNSVDAWGVNRVGQAAPQTEQPVQSPVVHQNDPIPESAYRGVQTPLPENVPSYDDQLPF